MSKTFSIISLGCPRNLVDSEYIASELKASGYAFMEQVKDIDTLVVNTCAFIEDAKKESIDVILKAIDAKKSGDVKKIIVAGCLPERYAMELKKEFKDIDEFRGVLAFKSRGVQQEFKLTSGHYAYVKISEGCGNRCSYCIIPYLKGPYKSKEIDSIVEEVRTLVKNGVKEIVLVGQDTSLYGIDLYGKKKLAELLKKICSVAGESWIRLLYCHPANLDRDVIRLIRDSGNICKYIDLPVEHISDRILKKMGRRSGKKDILSLIDHIRAEIPGIALRSSLIVGFPDETEKDFQELLSFIRDVKFERLGIFRYSREEGTPAYRYKGHIPEKEKERRFDMAMSLQQEVSLEVNERFKGQILKVLIEDSEKDYYIGRTEYDAPEVDGLIYIKGKELQRGNFYNVRVTSTYEYDLVSEVL
ncbi:MAG: 30S ribosomal protein S12 methylthiotransferase RimO [Candidatus Omnitrophica bacterium]|nr:30S ribosomal protein S12 methylthiotransferase RimO [Candidatus Omnitrophota bacterium]